MTRAQLPQESPSPLSKPRAALLSLLTLVTFTQAQSLYEMLAGNRELLALRLESNWQLVEIVLVFNWLPALLLFGLWGALSRLHPAAARMYLALVCFIFFITFFFQLDNAYFLDHWKGFPHSYWLWLLPALGLSLALLRFEKASLRFLWVLSPVVVLFPLLFLARTWADTGSYVPAASPGVSADNSHKLPPIIVLVLDELALPAMLDDAGQIDARRFPHFYALAQQSHWFRNATANADHTTRSIPALLTGNLPLPDGSPSYRVYPENLFTWLQPRYRVYLGETWTRFCVPRVFSCLGSLHENTAGRHDLYRDILALYADRVLPGGLNSGRQEDSRTWALLRDPHRLMRLRLEQFEKLMQTVETLPGEKPFLLFFHHDLPHSPYWLNPDGVLREVKPAKFDPTLTRDSVALAEVFERYRQQIAFVDQELGRFLAALKARDLYDRTLLIVTSDHGVSYRAQAPGRNFMTDNGRIANADLLLSVPLLIKLPHQTQGSVSDRDVQLIDVLPSVAEVLSLQVPWQVSGRSVFGDPGDPRPKVAFDRTGQRFEFPDDLGLTAIAYGLEAVTAARVPIEAKH